MPPKACLPDPLSLDNIITTLTTASPPEQKAYSIVTLSTVIHHPIVKKILSNPKYNNVLKSIVINLYLIDNYSVECRWEVLTIIGELCRVEHKEKKTSEKKKSGIININANNNNNINNNKETTDGANELAKYFYTFFANYKVLKTRLIDIINDNNNSDPDVAIAAKDILECLPVDNNNNNNNNNKTNLKNENNNENNNNNNNTTETTTDEKIQNETEMLKNNNNNNN
eukprot:Tbor_TRINITY_DN4972_c3_g6::TRINITY_DN4972_c3_g6_i1::g.9887::m.9887